jgi:predicted CoA-substrate-specific enzyme activase
MYYVGIDSGSAYTKSVCVKKGDMKRIDIIAYDVIPTTADMKKCVVEVFKSVLKKANVSRGEVKAIVATGYGGKMAKSEIGGEVVTQITCHARGAKYLFPNCRSVIDIGGQDTKVIRLNKEGKVIAFEMNDKCAAGTGRFLEVMSRVLNVNIDEFGEISLKSKNKADITSTCTVFAETEVISLISQGTSKEEIILGLTESLASRVAALAKMVGIEEDIVMTGGVAKNSGLVKALERNFKHKIYVPEEPIIVGALGAALISSEL